MKNFSDPLLCNVNNTLFDALQIINNNGKGVTIIVDDNKKLCGILTDGDIRKLIIKDTTLKTPVKDIMNKRFTYATIDDDPKKILGLASEKIRIIPIVDKDFIYQKFYELDSRIFIPVASPELGGNELKYLIDAFISTWISSKGSYITKFEEEFAQFCECKYGVAVSNGTAALHLALLALGIKTGDEVIVPDLTFAATINCVLYTNATPVIVDIDPVSWCVNSDEIEKAITPKTKAIIAVHLYGQPCEMDKIMKIARKHKIHVVEDCAEAHGATYTNKRVGSIGDVGCFSFYGNKIITTGEGGMCTTKSKTLAEKIRMLRDHGMSNKKKYWHDLIGYNYRMTNLQAAIGLAQLERIEEILTNREQIENGYRESLKDINTIQFQHHNLPKRKKITWLVSALVKKLDRDYLLKLLKKKGIDSRPFFYPLSAMEIYRKYVFSNSESTKISALGLNFPTNSSINNDTLNTIRNILLKAIK